MADKYKKDLARAILLGQVNSYLLSAHDLADDMCEDELAERIKALANELYDKAQEKIEPIFKLLEDLPDNE